MCHIAIDSFIDDIKIKEAYGNGKEAYGNLYLKMLDKGLLHQVMKSKDQIEKVEWLIGLVKNKWDGKNMSRFVWLRQKMCSNKKQRRKRSKKYKQNLSYQKLNYKITIPVSKQIDFK